MPFKITAIDGVAEKGAWRQLIAQTGTRHQYVFTQAPNRLVQKSGFSAVGNMTDLPVKASCVVSAQTISGHWPNGLNDRR